MTFSLRAPEVDHLDDVLGALRRWQREDAPDQLHPGDLGWFWRHGASEVAKALRVWHHDEEIAAIGFLDGPSVLRMTVSPERWTDGELAREVATVVSDPELGVLPAGEASVEVPNGARLQDVLRTGGWGAGEAWTPLRRDLTEPIEELGLLRVEVVDAGTESAFTAVHRSAWGNQAFTDGPWETMAAGAPFDDARCLLGWDREGVAVAGVTVWSAGVGRPGLIEPMGVHAHHRRKGYGWAVCVAAGAALRELGASSALVCTPSSLTSAIATYRSAGFVTLPERLDSTRVLSRRPT